MSDMDGGDGHGHGGDSHGHGGHGHGFGHGHGHGHGHGADAHDGGHITHEALVMAFSHGHNSDHVSTVGEHVSSASAHSAHIGNVGPGRQDSQPANQVGTPADSAETRTFIVHVANHGRASITTVLEQYSREFDLIRIDKMRPNYDSADMIKYEIADWTAFTEPYMHVNMPEGHYPGATGHTRITRQFWQVGKRPSLWAPRTKPVFDKLAMTFIEITRITWRYFETGDYETKFVLTVGSLPVWDETANAWGYKREPFIAHQRAARKICERVFKYLTETEPSPGAKILRREMNLKYPPVPEKDRPDGVVPGTPEDEADLTRGRREGEDREPHPVPGGGGGDEGGGDEGGDEAVSLIAPESTALVASGVNLDAVLGHADSVVVAGEPVPPAVKKADLVVEIDD